MKIEEWEEEFRKLFSRPAVREPDWIVSHAQYEHLMEIERRAKMEGKKNGCDLVKVDEEEVKP